MNDPLYEYLKKEWRFNCHPKYLRYFDEWYKNLTEWQRFCYSVCMEGKLGPFIK